MQDPVVGSAPAPRRPRPRRGRCGAAGITSGRRPTQAGHRDFGSSAGRDQSWCPFLPISSPHTRRLGVTLHVRLAEHHTPPTPAAPPNCSTPAATSDPDYEDAARLAIRAYAWLKDTAVDGARLRSLRAALDELDELDELDNETP